MGMIEGLFDNIFFILYKKNKKTHLTIKTGFCFLFLKTINMLF